jgi:hypothetical protein
MIPLANRLRTVSASHSHHSDLQQERYEFGGSAAIPVLGRRLWANWPRGWSIQGFHQVAARDPEQRTWIAGGRLWRHAFELAENWQDISRRFGSRTGLRAGPTSLSQDLADLPCISVRGSRDGPAQGRRPIRITCVSLRMFESRLSPESGGIVDVAALRIYANVRSARSPHITSEVG